MSGHGELYDSVKNIVAKLYVLRESCKGKIQTEKSRENHAWFLGAGTVLLEAVAELQKALLDLDEMTSNSEKEEKDWSQVERLIKKLDDSTVSESLYS